MYEIGGEEKPNTPRKEMGTSMKQQRILIHQIASLAFAQSNPLAFRLQDETTLLIL